MKSALYWKSESQGGLVRCLLCPHACRIAENGTGLCRIRRNVRGRLRAEGYGRISSSNVDPIEKKPLYHFYPGTDVFSIGGWGCNFRCSFCQNWSISQEGVGSVRTGIVNPARLLEAVTDAGTQSIAYTYNEPLINIEYILDCARLAGGRGIRNIVVTNGYISTDAACDVIDSVDAFNVDIKSMDNGFYKRNCGGEVVPVLDFCKAVVRAGRHLEITNLVIPGENDSDSAIEMLAEWMAVSLGAHVPLHLSAYRPMYKMSRAATSLADMNRAFDIACRYLQYVYTGNVISAKGASTNCPECGSVIITRVGYDVCIQGRDGACCADCGCELAGFFWPVD